MNYERMEQVHAQNHLSVPAADLDGDTSYIFGEESEYEGLELADFGDILDRDEVGIVQWVSHRLDVAIVSTGTSDGTARVAAELSFSPAASPAFTNVRSQGRSDYADQTGVNFTIEALDPEGTITESGDVVGSVLTAYGTQAFSDGATGVGGSGVPGSSEWEGPVMVDPVVDDRDALYSNGVIEVNNVADAAVHVDVSLWASLGVMED